MLVSLQSQQTFTYVQLLYLCFLKVNNNKFVPLQSYRDFLGEFIL